MRFKALLLVGVWGPAILSILSPHLNLITRNPSTISTGISTAPALSLGLGSKTPTLFAPAQTILMVVASLGGKPQVEQTCRKLQPLYDEICPTYLPPATRVSTPTSALGSSGMYHEHRTFLSHTLSLVSFSPKPVPKEEANMTKIGQLTDVCILVHAPQKGTVCTCRSRGYDISRSSQPFKPGKPCHQARLVLLLLMHRSTE